MLAEIGRCRNDPCGQVDLLPYDGYCSESCREHANQGGEDQDPDHHRDRAAQQHHLSPGGGDASWQPTTPSSWSAI